MNLNARREEETQRRKQAQENPAAAKLQQEGVPDAWKREANEDTPT